MGRTKAASSRRRRIILTLEVLLVLGIGIVAVWWFLRPDDDERRKQKSDAAAAAFKASEYEKAALLYRALLKESPRHIELQMNLAFCLARMNRLDEAEATVLKAVKIGPGYAPAHLFLSDLAWARGDVETAIREARLATEGKKVSRGARLTLAERLIEAGQTTEGTGILVTEIEADRGGDAAVGRLVPWITEDGPMSAAHVRAARQLDRAYIDAQKEYEAAPDSPEALRKFVPLALISGEPLPALDALRKAAEQRDLSVEEKLLLVRALAQSGEIDEARKFMEIFEGGAVEDRVEAWLLVDAPQMALSTLDAVPDDEERSPALRRLELKTLIEFSRTPGGVAGEAMVSQRIIDVATSILDVYPGDEMALAARSPALLTRGRLREALRDALSLRRVAPASPAGGWLQGLVLMASGRAASARLLLAGPRGSRWSGDARWLAEASIRVGDGSAALRELEGYMGIGATALRVAALALAKDTVGARDLAATPEFGEEPLRERLLAAKALALRDEAGVARALIDELGTYDASVGPLLEIGDLHLVLGDRAAAGSAFEAAAAADSPVALAALGRLAELALSEEPRADETFTLVLDRLRGTDGGEQAARILEGRACLVRGEPEKALALAGQALAAEPGDPDARILRLSALLVMGKEGEEISKSAEAVLEILPGHGPARVVRARRLVDGAKAALARGIVTEASENLNEAVDLIPGASEALFLRGIVSVSTGEIEAAEEDAKLLIESPGGAAPGNYLTGVLRMQQGKLAEAEASFRASLSAEPESAVAAAGLAGVLLASRESQQALELAEDWLGRDPEAIWAVRTKAFALAGLGKASEGAEILTARAGDDTAMLPLRMMAGWLLFQDGKHAEAASEFGAVVEGQPLNARARALQLEACLAAKDRTGAWRVVGGALARDDLGPVGLLLRARLRATEGDRVGCENDLRQAVVEAPDDPVARFLLGDSLAVRGDIEDAREHLERAAALLPAAAQPRLTLALIASEQGRDRDAAKLYEEVLRLQPGNALAANNLAHHLTGSPAAPPERPVELARMAVSAAPQFAPFHDTLAMALAAAGEYDEACKEADRALEIDGKKPNIQVNAAKIHRDAGNIERAREIARLAIEAAEEEEKEALQRRMDELNLYPDEDDGEK